MLLCQTPRRTSKVVFFTPCEVILSAHFDGIGFAGTFRLEDFLKERDAPTATGTRPIALGYLTGYGRICQADKLSYLLIGNMEADTDLVVFVHGGGVGVLRFRRRGIHNRRIPRPRDCLGGRFHRCIRGFFENPPSGFENSSTKTHGILGCFDNLIGRCEGQGTSRP